MYTIMIHSFKCDVTFFLSIYCNLGMNGNPGEVCIRLYIYIYILTSLMMIIFIFSFTTNFSLFTKFQINGFNINLISSTNICIHISVWLYFTIHKQRRTFYYRWKKKTFFYFILFGTLYITFHLRHTRIFICKRRII